MQIEPLTIIVTSCDRFDLLEKTLDSFFALNKYRYVEFHIHNDSTNEIPKELIDRYSDKNITWHFGKKRGLSASWDYLISQIKTEYFFNLEDDWLFEGNSNFIEDSIQWLFSFDQVWIRDKSDHNHPLKKLNNDIDFVLHTKDWCGFTFNPSVRKLSKWKQWFPNGISGKDEIELSRELSQNYAAVSLINSACKHIGWNRHSQNFKI
jgi:hypothetical protein